MTDRYIQGNLYEGGGGAAFLVAADRVRQGPLYRGSLYSEKRTESKKLAVMGRWPFYRGDR